MNTQPEFENKIIHNDFQENELNQKEIEDDFLACKKFHKFQMKSAIICSVLITLINSFLIYIFNVPLILSIIALPIILISLFGFYLHYQLYQTSMEYFLLKRKKKELGFDRKYLWIDEDVKNDLRKHKLKKEIRDKNGHTTRT